MIARISVCVGLHCQMCRRNYRDYRVASAHVCNTSPFAMEEACLVRYVFWNQNDVLWKSDAMSCFSKIEIPF